LLSNLYRYVPVQIEKLLKRELKSLSPTVAAEIVKVKAAAGGGDSDGKAQAKAIEKALPAAVAAAMASTLVPKFEAACGDMFEQVRGTFERGMDDIATELYTQKENAVAAEVGPLVSSLRAASAEVRSAAEILLTEIPAAVAAGGGGSGEGGGGPMGGATSLEELEQQMDPTLELGRLVDEGSLEEAFTKALGLSSVEMVTWVCSKVEPTRETVFDTSPAPLSQGVLLSLMQQLSCDLADEPQLKLAWIRDACLAVDPSDPMLSQHMRPILESVFNGLHEAATSADTPAPVKSDLRLCVHVVNSLLSACK
jgi:enhancer of mRNA-decapping protein 4